MKIRILITGGTFDKVYDPISGTLIFKNTHVSEILLKGRSSLDLTVETLMLMDSLEMTDAHREIILESCRNALEERILITHGTDTLQKTARFLQERISGKTIVLTGAMVPYSFQDSDSTFNLAAALAFTQTLSHGVYAAMNGRFFEAQNVSKDRTTGLFTEPSQQKD